VIDRAQDICEIAIDGLVSEGVLNKFKGESGAEGYRVNDKELFTQKLKKWKAIQHFVELQEHFVG